MSTAYRFFVASLTLASLLAASCVGNNASESSSWSRQREYSSIYNIINAYYERQLTKQEADEIISDLRQLRADRDGLVFEESLISKYRISIGPSPRSSRPPYLVSMPSIFDIFGSIEIKYEIPRDPPIFTPLRNHQNDSGSRLWVLMRDYVITEKNGENKLTIPKYFTTDFASIPAVLRARYNPADFAEAALVHDYLYAHGAPGRRKDADRIFLDVLLASGIPRRRARELFRGVRTGGAGGYGLREDFRFYIPSQDALILAPAPRNWPFEAVGDGVEPSAVISSMFGSGRSVLGLKGVVIPTGDGEKSRGSDGAVTASELADLVRAIETAADPEDEGAPARGAKPRVIRGGASE